MEWVGWGTALAVDAVALIRTDTRGAQLGAILAVLAASVAARWAWTALKLGFICLVATVLLSLTNTIAFVVEVIDLGDLVRHRARPRGSAAVSCSGNRRSWTTA